MGPHFVGIRNLVALGALGLVRFVVGCGTLLVAAGLSACSSPGAADISDSSSAKVGCASSQAGCTTDAGTSAEAATVADSSAAALVDAGAESLPLDAGARARVPANFIYTGDQTEAGTYSAQALADPAIDGVTITIEWAQAEPDAPVGGVHTYDWAPYDRELAAWRSKGKKAALVVRVVAEGTSDRPGCTTTNPENFLPSWEADFLLSPASPGGPKMVCSVTRHVYVPDYFDETFIADLHTFWQAVADHFGGSPDRDAIAYSRFGTGMGGEGFPMTPTDDMIAWNQLVSWGYSGLAWTQWVEAQLGFISNSLAEDDVPGPLDHGINGVYNIDGVTQDCDCVDPVTHLSGENWAMVGAYWAASQGLAVGFQSLDSTTTYQKAISDFITLHWPNVFHQFQPFGAEGNVATMANYAYCFGGGDDGNGTTRNGPQPVDVEWYSTVVATGHYDTTLDQFAGYQSGTVAVPLRYCAGL
jgi:hypothetical protein